MKTVKNVIYIKKIGVMLVEQQSPLLNHRNPAKAYVYLFLDILLQPTFPTDYSCGGYKYYLR